MSTDTSDDVVERSDFPVQSDVHWAVARDPAEEHYISRFVFVGDEVESSTTETVGSNDGDLDPPRKRRRTSRGALTIRHAVDTFMPDVGLQVWPGSLLLAEYFFSLLPHQLPFAAVELGCGTGFAGLALALAGAPSVMLTDHHVDVLENALANVHRNAHAFTDSTVTVKQLDLLRLPTGCQGACDVSTAAKGIQRNRFHLEASDIPHIFACPLIFAADVVYDPPLVEALFTFIDAYFSHNAEGEALLALEKRINFCLDEMAPVAPGYQQFEICVQNRPSLCGHQVFVDFHHFLPYERGPELELWRFSKDEHRVASKDPISGT
eukprot:GGOE01061305.1.p1 GENE.GGOE01061305.1~~GGOE01061305.1.p1  ORF type:complete len:329 (-),score=78.86 GGOE01061305.1:32-997(-)